MQEYMLRPDNAVWFYCDAVNTAGVRRIELFEDETVAVWFKDPVRTAQ
jgi:hypothetical protein